MRCLRFTAAARKCALPIEHIAETLRPRPVDVVKTASPFVRGVARIRGAAVPVVDVAALAFGEPSATHGRFITVRAGSRLVALAVDAVDGVVTLDEASAAEMPPLLRSDVLERIASADDGLVIVLSAARLVEEGA